MRKKVYMILMALVLTGAVWYLLWKCGAFLPGWIRWEGESFCDRTGRYEILVKNKSASVRSGGEILWKSPEGVKIQQALSGDIDNDGEDELLLLCWKVGRFGKYRPFWVEKDEKKWSQHLFVYEYGEKELRPKWMSSYLGVTVDSMALSGQEPLSSYLWLTDTEGKESCWRWDSWGFTREETEVSFAVFGDNLIHEPIYRYGLNQDDFGFLFEQAEDVIAESDIAVLSQETPLTDNPSWYGGYPRFGTPVQVGEAICEAGFDVVACATNHALDRGKEGVDFTKKFFDSKGIRCLGIQAREETEYRPFEVITRNGIRFGMLNYTYGTNGIRMPEENPSMVHLLADENQVRSDLVRAGEEADIVLVFVHWGTENSEQSDEFQKKWTRIFLEEGADVVVGTHPHALQPFEVLEGENGRRMLVYYSIGNYISAQKEQSCVKGGIAEFTISRTSEGYQIAEYDLLPLTISRREKGRYTVELPQSQTK